MLGIVGCCLLVLCQLSGLQALSLDTLVSQSNIYYYQKGGPSGPAELPLDSVMELATTQSLKLIVHGFLGSRTHSSIQPLSNAYKAQGYDNILIADWAPAANLDYASSRRAVDKVAKQLAKRLQPFLARHNISRNAVHIIGHSLGAHIAGRIGNYFNGTLARVTGLDPALPLFTPRSNDSLRPNAAQFVDVIHTDFPVFGDFTPRGTVDFYPNFGQATQPGCPDVDLLAATKLIVEAYSCSHNRAVLFYAESVGLPKNFPALPCSLQAIKSRHANGCSTAVDEHEVAYMGEQVTRSATSYYYLETNAAPPFGQGVHAEFY